MENAFSVKAFHEKYREKLLAAVQKQPGDYMLLGRSHEEYADAVAERMVANVVRDAADQRKKHLSVNVSPAFRAAMKHFGITTQAGLLEALRGV